MRFRTGLLGLCLLTAECAALQAPIAGPPARTAQTLEWRAFHSFTSADGLAQNSIIALLQDRDGFVYAGTFEGVSRYDGRQWRTLELPTAGRRYAVGALAEDSDGALWVGTDSEGVWRLRGQTAEKVPLQNSGPINAMLAQDDGIVWVGTALGLDRCDAQQCVAIAALDGLGVRSLLAEHIEGEPRLWLGTNGHGVVQLRGLDQAQPPRVGSAITREHGLPNGIGLSIARFAGDLWIGTGRGLARLHGDRLVTYGERNGFPVSMVFGLQEVEVDDGRTVLMASLRPGGLAQIETDGNWRLIGSEHGLPSHAAHALLLERYRGLLWVGSMTGGIARLERERWTLFDERSGLPDRLVLGVGWSQAAGGTLWVGTARGAVRWHGGRFVPLLPPSHASALVYDLLDAPDGSRWMATGSGLLRWRGEQLLQAYSVDNSELPAVSADRLVLRRTPDGGFEIYAATGHGLARWRARDGLRRVRELGEPANEGPIRAFAIEPSADPTQHDVLWMIGGGRLFRFDGAHWEPIEHPCAPGTSLFGIAVESTVPESSLWLATRNGLRHIDPEGRCQVWTAADRLGALSHVRLLGHQLYVFGSRGVLRLDRRGAPDQAGTLFNADSGLSSTEMGSSAIDDRGRLFAGSADGLAALTPEPARAAPQAAPLRLLAAEFGADRQPLRAGAHLPHQHNSVRFRYALLAFDREPAIRYRVQLAGLQEAPGGWSPAGEVAFERLPSGSFELIIEARDAHGVPATPMRFGFTVAAPWWQEPWARLGAPLLLVALGLALGRWRMHAVRRRAHELEQEVAARTRDLAAANVQLEAAAITDPLTGLKNRRFFALAAAAEAERARRAGPSGALLLALLDIDHFKSINDTHGHDVGDAVLQEVARRLLRVARGGDFVLRWGGEEFLLLLRDLGADAADQLLLRVLHAIGAEPFILDGLRLGVTASIGAAAFPPEHADANPAGLEPIITMADAALYRAKRAGRHRAIRVVVGAGQACSDVSVLPER